MNSNLAESQPNSLSERQALPINDPYQYFLENDWTLVKNVIPKSQIDFLREEILKVSENLDPNVGTDKSSKITKLLFKSNRASSSLIQAYKNQTVQRILRSRQKSPFIEHSKVLAKAPGGNETAWHQDGAFWQRFDPECSMITVWIAISEVNQSNGCLRVLNRDAEDGRLFEHELVSQGQEKRIKQNSLQDIISKNPVELGIMEPGDALIFGAKVVHGSFPNTTDSARLAFKMVFQDLNKRPKTEPIRDQAVILEGAQGFVNQSIPCFLPRLKMRKSSAISRIRR